MSYVFFSAKRDELNFSIDSKRDSFTGASGSPIMDKTGKVVGVFTSYGTGPYIQEIGAYIYGTGPYVYGFGAPVEFLSYSANKDLVYDPQELFNRYKKFFEKKKEELEDIAKLSESCKKSILK